MSFSSLNDNSKADVIGMCLEVTEPSLLALPISDIPLDLAAPIELFIAIGNTSSTPLPFVYGIITPELVGTGGQPFRPQKLIEHQVQNSTYPGVFLPPRRPGALVHVLTASLSRQQDSFQLHVQISEYLRSSNPGSSWLFDELALGIYQLRLTYRNPENNFSVVDLGQKVDEVIGLETFTATTSAINLYLVKPLGASRQAVMVEGIRFETVIPEPRLEVPSSPSAANIPLQFGLELTNTTSTPFRFCSHFGSMILDLLGEGGFLPRQPIGGGASLGMIWLGPKKSDFHLVMPGERISLLVTASLEPQADNTWNLRGASGYGDNYIQKSDWSIENLKPGNYRLRVTYRSPNRMSIESFFPDLAPLLENLWEGKVYTPLQNLQLLQV